MTNHNFLSALQQMNLSSVEMALAILWERDRLQPDCSYKPGALARIMFESGLGNVNSTRLGRDLKASGDVLESKKGMRLKVLARQRLSSVYAHLVEMEPPAADQENGYLPKQVWTGTRPYVESVCEELNSCVEYGLYNAASVLIRRIVETLIIECFEQLGRESELKKNGNYMMLNGLISVATSTPGLKLGRESKQWLTSAKILGDRAAHNRYYIARKSDLAKAEFAIRVVVEELIQIAMLRSSSPTRSVA